MGRLTYRVKYLIYTITILVNKTRIMQIFALIEHLQKIQILHKHGNIDNKF